MLKLLDIMALEPSSTKSAADAIANPLLRAYKTGGLILSILTLGAILMVVAVSGRTRYGRLDTLFLQSVRFSPSSHSHTFISRNFQDCERRKPALPTTKR